MKIKKVDSNIYRIVENGLIANPYIGEGRMIPALVLNSKTDDRLKDLLNIHHESPPGDIEVQWAIPFTGILKHKVWYLHIDFFSPMEFSFQIEFDLKNDYSLINAIFKARGLYIGYGHEREKVSIKHNDMILLEIPDTDTDKLWEKVLYNVLKKKLKKQGVPKKNIKKEIRNHINKMNEILSIRTKIGSR